MVGFIGNFGPWELILIMFIILIIVGPGKLPKVGESMGKAIQSFRKAQNDNIEEANEKSDVVCDK